MGYDYAAEIREEREKRKKAQENYERAVRRIPLFALGAVIFASCFVPITFDVTGLGAVLIPALFGTMVGLIAAMP